MLEQEITINNNNLHHLASVLQARIDKVEGKTTDYDQSGAMQQPQFGMPLNFYDNQSSFAAASKLASAPSAHETDKAGHPGASTSTGGAQPSARALRTDHGASRASGGGTMFYLTHRSRRVKFLRFLLMLLQRS
jgi:hypothetical protein